MKFVLILFASLLTCCSYNREQEVNSNSSTERLEYLDYERIDKFSGNDSLIIAYYIRLLDAELSIGFEYDPEDSMYSILVNRVMNEDESVEEAFPNNTVASWSNGEVYYAPDSAFKIFVFEGNQGGATAQPMYHSLIQLKSGKTIRYFENEMTPIKSFYQAGPKNYVIIQSSWSGGNAGGTNYSISQLSIENDSVSISTLLNENQNTELNRYLYSGSFKIHGSNGMEDLIYLKHDSINNRINFSYAKTGYELENYEHELIKLIPKSLFPVKPNEIILVTGEFEIVNQKIVNFQESYLKQVYEN